VAATAALTLQLFAGASSAAVPAGTSSGSALGEIGGDGYAGFRTAFTFQDNNLAKLYFEAVITNGASVPVFEATRSGKSVNCSVTATVIEDIPNAPAISGLVNPSKNRSVKISAERSGSSDIS